ncbi:DUF6884 domain-containing protein [Candidatus Caldatribacterium sp.]|uniref:DUF6884 domain-containing protein n=1 Tax=Candidatus Caldatribacterium sp. TaxID=2282143 RepID=UPI00383EBA0F|nr:hypothetical protein [Candidatus Caldatribacterium sp.]
MVRRLLIMSCSSRKHKVVGTVRAWDLYDGVAFRLVKKLQREGKFPEDVDILILSARYGLISPTEEIEFYDQQMTHTTACEQVQHNVLTLQHILSVRNYREVFMVAGSTYLEALRPFAAWVPVGVKVTVASGGIGEKLQKMKRWLEVGTQ